MILSQGNCIPFICRSDNNFISWGCTLSCPPSLKESISRLSPLPNVFFVPRDSLPKSLFEIYINVIECVWPSGDRRAVNTFCLPLTLAAILKPKTWVRLCNKACSSWEGGCEGGGTCIFSIMTVDSHGSRLVGQHRFDVSDGYLPAFRLLSAWLTNDSVLSSHAEESKMSGNASGFFYSRCSIRSGYI